jgi:hypothetical protein
MSTALKLTRTFIALALFTTGDLLAQPNLVLNHDSSWVITGRQCIIRASEIMNLGNEDTGPLYLSIYAKSDTGYDGTGSPGRLLARAAIDPLPALSARNNIVVAAKLRTPRRGEKFTALLVEEKIGRHYVPANYVVYTSTYTFPRKQNGGVGSDDSAVGQGELAFHGQVSLTGSRRRGDFSVEKIQNHRDGIDPTGPLRLAIYATPEPYDGSAAPRVIATRTLGRLAPGDFYHQLQGRMTLKRPGRGLFHLTLALEEDQGGGFAPVLHVAVPDPRQF